MTLKKTLKKIHLSWFDGVVIFLSFFMLVTVFVLFYRKSTYIDVRVKVTDEMVLYANTKPKSWYANQFEVGDKELDSLGRTLTEIIKVEKFPSSPTEVDVYVTLRVKSTFNSRTNTYSTKGRLIAFGVPLRVSLAHISFNGIVVGFPGMTLKEKERDLLILSISRAVEPYLAESLNTGDKITDSEGNVIAEIIEIQKDPALRVTQTAAGDLLLKRDPLYVDLHIKLKMKAKELNNELFTFDYVSVKVGEVLPLNFTHVSYFPSVTKVEVIK